MEFWVMLQSIMGVSKKKLWDVSNKILWDGMVGTPPPPPGVDRLKTLPSLILQMRAVITHSSLQSSDDETGLIRSHTYRSDTANSNTVNSKFHLIQTFC